MDLLEQIETYLQTSGIPPTKFGRIVVGDPRFVGDLRSGRRPRRRTHERVEAFINTSKA